MSARRHSLATADNRQCVRQLKYPVKRSLSESTIIQQLAHALCQRISRKTIRALQGMTEALLSGDDSVLKSTWDEICVQVQYEESYAWGAYHATVHAWIDAEVENLQGYEREAIWLQTPQGEEWDCENADEREPYPVFNADVVDYIIQEYIYREAGRWTNSRIRQYLDRATLRD